MKKFIILFALSLLCASCVIDDADTNRADFTTQYESVYLVSRFAVKPSDVLSTLLVADDYLNASEEEKKDSCYDNIRKRLMKGDGGKYKVSGIGYFYSDEKRLSEAGSHWKVETQGYYSESYYWYGTDGYNGTADTLSVNCIVSNKEWTVAFPGGVTGTISQADSTTFNVKVSGSMKSADGYDISFRTEDGFIVVISEKGVNSGLPAGTFYHTVSSDGKILMTCTALHYADNPSDTKYIMTR